MQYNYIKLDDYDKKFKIKDEQILCYSKDAFNDLPDEVKIVSEMYKYKPDDDADDTILIEGKKYPVFEPDSTNRLFYSLRGYINVKENEYIALYKSRIPFFLWLFSIALLALIALMLIFNLTKAPDDENPTFNPLPPVDSNAYDIGGTEEPTKTDSASGGEVTLDYSPSATLTLSTKNIDIDFTNPSVSTHEIVLELYVVSQPGASEQEIKIAESGRIPAGHKLDKMTFTADPQIFEGEGKYFARYHLNYYDPLTGEKSLVDSVLDEIMLTVNK